MKSLDELVNTDEPGLALVREWMSTAVNPVEMLPCHPLDGERTLLELQITTRSPMGAIAHGTGGLLVDRAWVRVLGAGCERLPRSIATWNELDAGRPMRLDGALLIGDDAVGGFFGLSAGGIPVAPRTVGYYAPDALEWEDTGVGYSDWLRWLFTGDLEAFYENARWPGWREEVEPLAGDRALHVWPPLWAAGPPVEKRSRKPVPLEELWGLYVEDMPSQIRKQQK